MTLGHERNEDPNFKVASMEASTAFNAVFMCHFRGTFILIGG